MTFPIWSWSLPVAKVPLNTGWLLVARMANATSANSRNEDDGSLNCRELQIAAKMRGNRNPRFTQNENGLHMAGEGGGRVGGIQSSFLPHAADVGHSSLLRQLPNLHATHYPGGSLVSAEPTAGRLMVLQREEENAQICILLPSTHARELLNCPLLSFH